MFKPTPNSPFFKQSAVVAAALTKEGKILTFKPNSIFNALELSSYSEQELNPITAAIANTVSANVVLLRNKILPVLNDFTEAIKLKHAETAMIDPYSKYNIIEVSVPDVVGELVAADIMFPKRPIKELPIAAITIPTPKAEEIRDYFKHPISSINIYMKQIIDQYTDDDLITIWERYLSNVSKTNTAISSMSYSGELKINELLALYTVITQIRENKNSTVVVDTDTYTNVMTMFMHEVLNSIAIAVSNLELFKSSERVVINRGSNTEGGITVSVVKDLYNTFIGEGYSVDAIFGMCIVETDMYNVSIYTLSNLRTRASDYASEWNKRIKIDKIASMPAEFERLKTIYILSTKVLYEKIIPGDLTEFISSGERETTDRLMSYFKTIPGSALYDIDEMARFIIGDIVFAKTNFKQFTNAMFEYIKLNKSVTPNEAASFAVVDLVMNYLLEQVQVVNGRIN